MNFNVLITGVGGQGTILASRILSTAGILEDIFVRTMETFGMAQRGGSVVGHIRFGEGEKSAYIPLGQADLLLGFELAETARNLGYVKSQGRVLVNAQALRPVSVAMGQQTYQVEAIETYIKDNSASPLLVDGLALAGQAGSAKAVNVVLLGAACGAGLLPFSDAVMRQAVAHCVPEQYRDLNLAAYELGFVQAKGGAK